MVKTQMQALPYEIKYQREHIPLALVYERVFLRKDALVAANFVCKWEFLEVNGTKILVGDFDYSPELGNRPVRFPTIWKPLGVAPDSVSIITSYLRSSRDVHMYGSTKVHRNAAKQQAILEALESFKTVTGIELLVEER